MSVQVWLPRCLEAGWPGSTVANTSLEQELFWQLYLPLPFHSLCHMDNFQVSLCCEFWYSDVYPTVYWQEAERNLWRSDIPSNACSILSLGTSWRKVPLWRVLQVLTTMLVQRSTMTSLTYSGAYVGTIVTFAISGILSCHMRMNLAPTHST